MWFTFFSNLRYYGKNTVLPLQGILQKFPLYYHYCCNERRNPRNSATKFHLLLLPEGEFLFHLHRAGDSVAAVVVESVAQHSVAVYIPVLCLEHRVAALYYEYAIAHENAVVLHSHRAGRVGRDFLANGGVHGAAAGKHGGQQYEYAFSHASASFPPPWRNIAASIFLRLTRPGSTPFLPYIHRPNSSATELLSAPEQSFLRIVDEWKAAVPTLNTKLTRASNWFWLSLFANGCLFMHSSNRSRSFRSSSIALSCEIVIPFAIGLPSTVPVCPAPIVHTPDGHLYACSSMPSNATSMSIPWSLTCMHLLLSLLQYLADKGQCLDKGKRQCAVEQVYRAIGRRVVPQH